MKTLVLERPKKETTAQEAKRAQRALAEHFLWLCDMWCRELIALGQQSPLLSVKALDGDRLQLVLRNGSRWIVQRDRGIT